MPTQADAHYVELTNGSYESRSLIAGAQRCVNLFMEQNVSATDLYKITTSEPMHFVHQCTPGLTLLSTAPEYPIRGLYTASNGNVFAVANTSLYNITSSWQWNLISALTPATQDAVTPRSTPVSMVDNGTTLFIVDGSSTGWYCDVNELTGFTIMSANYYPGNQQEVGFYGADKIDYSDTYFILNKPGTNEFYISTSEFVPEIDSETITIAYGGATYSVNDVLTLNDSGGATATVNAVDGSGSITTITLTTPGSTSTLPSNPIGSTGGTGYGATFNASWVVFDPLDFASKTAKPDPIVSIIVQKQVIWLLGSQSFEVWYNSGGQAIGDLATNTFPFQIFQGAFSDHGCGAKYSVAKSNDSIFWLSQDLTGTGIVMQGSGYSAKRISTHAIENTFYQYAQTSTINDAIGYCYNQEGHYFYVLNFPSADATWVFDSSEGQWHERVWLDQNGQEHRHLCNFAVNAFGTVIGTDWANGNLYEYDLNNYSDNGNPIMRLRAFPHQIDMANNRRVIYNQVIANMQVGTDTQAQGFNTVIACDFRNPDGTLLQNYSNLANVGATFTQINEGYNAVIYNDAMTPQGDGTLLYSVAGTPTNADYTVSFNMTPSNYEYVAFYGANAFVIARANESNNGYSATVSSDGTNYFITLIVLMEGGSSTSVELGTLASGFYTVTMVLVSNSITVSVQRSQDGNYVDIAGNWQGSPTQCISIVDSTFTLPGNILVGELT